MRVSSSTTTSSAVVVVIVFLVHLLSTNFLVVKAEEPDMDEVIPVPALNETVTDEVIIPVSALNETDTDEVAIRVPALNGTNIEGCPCIDVSSIISPLTSRICTLPATGENGIKVTIDGICAPYSYGSSKCLQHDLLHDPSCSLDNIGETPIEAFCFRPWCYIDAEACMKNSYERIYRSDYFSFDSGIDLYYSYSTCNSTRDDWLAAKDGKINDNAILHGDSIVATVPMYQSPSMFIICSFFI
jgi:hypothetical protein